MDKEVTKERLVELIRDTFNYTRGACIDFDKAVEINADYLIANGVGFCNDCKYDELEHDNKKFKSGDRAKIVNNIVGHKFKIGTVVTLQKSENDYVAKSDEGEFWWVVDGELEPITDGECDKQCEAYLQGGKNG
jgi:hypothetical protein